MSDDNEEARRILEDVFADECEAVGESNVSDLVAGSATYEQPEKGLRFDIVEALKALAEALVYIKTALEIFKLLKEQFGRKPTEQELEKAVKEKLPEPGISQEDQKKVLDKISKSG